MAEMTIEKADMIPDGTANLPANMETGLAAIALNLAMKYHDINMIKDGALYQQYKLEGRNIPSLHLDMVFETAIRIEYHLLNSPSRLADHMMELCRDTIEDVIDGLSEEPSQ